MLEWAKEEATSINTRGDTATVQHHNDDGAGRPLDEIVIRSLLGYALVCGALDAPACQCKTDLSQIIYSSVSTTQPNMAAGAVARMERLEESSKSSWSEGVCGTRSGTKWKKRKESTWDEEEEAMTGLVYSLAGNYLCALTGKPTAEKDSEYAKKSSPRRLHVVGRLCVQRFNKRRAAQGQAG